MPTPARDIRTREDITSLISSFYTKVRQDQLLAGHFAHVDWEHHTPIIIDFWSMILLGDQQYKGNPLSKHLHMKLHQKDFGRWVTLFHETVNELFQGEKADEAKQRASSIASIFQYKMGLR